MVALVLGEVGLAMLWALVAAGGVFDETSQGLAVACYGLLGAVALALMLRFPFVRTKVAGDVAVRHALFARERIEMAAAHVEETDGPAATVFTVVALAIETPDGSVVVLSELAGFARRGRSNRRVTRSVDTMLTSIRRADHEASK